MKKNKNYISGIGGVFIKSEDPKKMNRWYAEKLKLNMTEYGASFRFIDEVSEQKGLAQLSFFDQQSNYFDPSRKQTMINFRVRNIAEFVDLLKENGVVVLDEIESFEYGKFVHILDPEGNKIELWEPNDEGFGSQLEEDYQVNF